ncbi:MAG: tol-pal system YbgF family protein [Nitrospiria bacterium]
MKRIGNQGSYIIFLILLLQVGCGGPKLYRVSDARIEKLAQEVALLRAEPLVSKKGEVLEKYKDFLTEYGQMPSNLRAPALKRVGDLYMASANEQFIQKMEAYEAEPEGPPPLVDYERAIETYSVLLRTQSNYPDNDKALYTLARAHAESGERDLALPLLERLIKEYPESPHRLEAFFRLGEYYFDQHRYEEAAEAYTQTLSWKDPFFHDKARYKLGWTFFKQKTYHEAIKEFLTLIEKMTATQTTFSPENGTLVWEAMTYVSTSFRTLGGPSKMAVHFEENGSRRYEKDLYLMMGNQYMAERKVELGIETYQTFIRQHPLHPIAPIFSSYIIEAYLKQGEKKKAHAVRVQLVSDYASGGSWHRANDVAARERARPLVKSELHHLALTAHARAEKKKGKEHYQEASVWYRQFLEAFPKEKESPEVQFLLGESLMALKMYADAGAAFSTSAYGYADRGPERKAAYAAVVAYQKVKTPDGEEEFVILSKRFADNFPTDLQTPKVLFKAAERLFDRLMYAGAAAVLEELLRNYPKDKTAPASRKLVAHSYMKGKEFEKARKAYGLAISLLPEKAKKERKELSELRIAAIYKEGERQREHGRPDLAVVLFLDVFREAPRNELAPVALFEAGLLFESLKQPEKAIEAYGKLVRTYKRSPLVGKANLQAGLAYEALGKGLKAAAAFSVAARLIKDKEEARNLLWTAAQHYEKGNKWNKSYATFSRFIQRFPKHRDVPEALYHMAQARHHAGRFKEASKLYRRLVKQAPGTFFAAKALFQEGEESFKRFKAIRIKMPLAKSLKKKTRAFKAVVNLYTKAVETRELEVVTVSAYRLGEVFEHFAASLLNAERPKNLNEEQLEEYMFQLEEKAYPFEEKAITAYKSNVHRTQQTAGLYNEWVRKSYDRLAELRPAFYRRKERTEQIVSNIDPRVFSSKVGQETLARVIKGD